MLLPASTVPRRSTAPAACSSASIKEVLPEPLGPTSAIARAAPDLPVAIFCLQPPASRASPAAGDLPVWRPSDERGSACRQALASDVRRGASSLRREKVRLAADGV